MCRFAIDLLWVRYGKIGGGVAVVLNLLEGLTQLDDQFEVFLVVTVDNKPLFEKYTNDSRFKLIAIDIHSDERIKTVLAQNISLARVLERNNIDLCLEPDNYMPILHKGKIRYATVIHDLQAVHYPENFKKTKRLWLSLNWRNVMRRSEKIIAISEFTKADIISSFRVDDSKIVVIHDPISVSMDEIEDFEYINREFGIKKYEYYYTVSSLAKNKNLLTLLEMMKVLKQRGNKKKLVVSGIGSESALRRFMQLAEDRGIHEQVIVTGFVSNGVRNALYAFCDAFLFPSVFEGFGMPPVEAMLFGANVITTREASLPEATQEQALYVKDPYNAQEWAEMVCSNRTSENKIDISKYDKESIARDYLRLISRIV